MACSFSLSLSSYIFVVVGPFYLVYYDHLSTSPIRFPALSQESASDAGRFSVDRRNQPDRSDAE